MALTHLVRSTPLQGAPGPAEPPLLRAASPPATIMPPKKKSSSSSSSSSAAAAAAASSSSAASARSGLVLKGRWKLGQMLGEGACGQVFEGSDVTGTQREHAWVVKLTPLPAGGIAAGGKKKKLSKADEALKRNADTLYMEQLAYKNYMVGVPGVPALPLTLAYGEDQGFRFLVIQRLGQDLNQAFEAAGKRFPNARLADYGRQMLAALKRLHERQLVFIDVKPENFMLGLPTAAGGGAGEAASVFMVDFGLVEKYTASAGGHKPMEGQGAAGGVAGTPLFSSLAVHEGKPPARRDDLEGLGLVLLYFARGGELPWANATSDADCLAKKKGAALADLCKGVSGGEHLSSFLQRARALPYEATPDYDAFDRLLVQLGKAKDAAAGVASSSAAAAGGGGRKRGGGAGCGEENGGGGDGGAKKSRRAGGAASFSSSSSSGAAIGGRGRGRSGKQAASSSSSSSSGGGGGDGAAASESKSPAAWLAKAAGAVGKQLLQGFVDLTAGSPPLEHPKAGASLKRMAPSASAAGAEAKRGGGSGKGKGKRGRGDAGGAEADTGDVVEVSDDDEDESLGEVEEKENAIRAAASLALEAIAGPHKGQRFDLGTLDKAALVGGAEGALVALSEDRAVSAKHARLESTGREAVHSCKLVPVGGSEVLVNKVAVGKSGRVVFPGDMVQIGRSTLTLRRG